jgi:hypothetical protein
VTARAAGAVNRRIAARTDLNIPMNDLPAVVLSATVWVYWTCVGAMAVRVRRRTRKLAGIVPSQPLEQVMWLIWVPLVAAR